jgi:hypothetical protein
MSDGCNHMHGVVVARPSVDINEYDAVLRATTECKRLGLSLMTGPVTSVDHRAQLLDLKIAVSNESILLQSCHIQ